MPNDKQSKKYSYNDCIEILNLNKKELGLTKSFNEVFIFFMKSYAQLSELVPQYRKKLKEAEKEMKRQQRKEEKETEKLIQKAIERGDDEEVLNLSYAIDYEPYSDDVLNQLFSIEDGIFICHNIYTMTGGKHEEQLASYDEGKFIIEDDSEQNYLQKPIKNEGFEIMISDKVISGEVNIGLGSVRKAFKTMKEMGLISVRYVGNANHNRAITFNMRKLNNILKKVG